MKILVVSQYYYPEQFLINEIAPEFVKRGHEVTVLTGLPNYPSGYVPNEYKNGKKREESIEGVRIIRVNEHGRKKGKINLILNYISFAYYGTKKTKELSDYDLVLSYQLSPITMLMPAIKYSKKNKVPLLVYCLDIWPESAQAMIGTGTLYRLVEKYSRKLYQKCDKIAVTSESFIPYMMEQNMIKQEKVVYIPQHASGEMLDFDLTSEENGIADFMFAGNLGKGQKIEVILKAVREIKQKDINTKFIVHIVGDGSMRDTLEQMTIDYNITDKVIFYGNQPREKMKEWYQRADVLLITLRGNNFVGNTMPGKLQTYMTTGKPILGSINGSAQQIIEEAKCGACVSAENPHGLAELMLNYINKKENYSECGKNARDYFKKHFTLPIYIDRLENTMKELV